MTAIRTWSERTEPKYRDCPQRSYLMALLSGGARIPNAYTGAEGERFEDAEGLPESEQEQGLVLLGPCDTAARALYGVTAHDAFEVDLPALLTMPGYAVVLSGMGPGLPGGYTGPHCVTVLPVAAGGLDVYNPLNAMGAGPDHTSVAAILAWHRALPNDIRYVREDEFLEAPVIDLKKATILSHADITAGATAYKQAVMGAAYYTPNPYPAVPNVPVYGQETRSDGAHGFWVGLQEGVAFVGAGKVILRPMSTLRIPIVVNADGSVVPA